MDLTFWGVRGSCPISRPDNHRYGGNSTCLHVRRDGGDEWIIDAGSGIHVLGREMMQREFGRGQGFARILISHTHWDHILGFPFFAPLYVEGNRFEIWSAGQPGTGIQAILAGQQLPDNFPVPFASARAEMTFRSLVPGEAVEVGGVRVDTLQLNHPGLTLGYSLEATEGAAAKLVVYTDNARIDAVRLGDDMEDTKPAAFHAAMAEHVAGADLLVPAAQFDEARIAGKEHWGHSTPGDCVALAQAAGAGHVSLFHHAPEHGDARIDDLLAEARALAPSGMTVSAAAEGEVVHLGGGAA